MELTLSPSTIELASVMRNQHNHRAEEKVIEANVQRINEERKQVQGNVGRFIDVYV
jgi:hypothetical protein